MTTVTELEAALVRALGLSAAEGRVLCAILAHPGTTARALSRVLHAEYGTICYSARNLVHRGLVQRRGTRSHTYDAMLDVVAARVQDHRELVELAVQHLGAPRGS